MNINDSELRGFIVDLGKAPGRAVKPLDAVVEKAALNIKNDLAEQAAGSQHFKRLAPAITYDRVNRIGSLGAEIGPDKSKSVPGKRKGPGTSGNLGNIFFFGGANGGGGKGDLDGPVDAEEPRMMENIEKVMGDLL